MSLSADANYMSGQINVSGDTDRTYDPVIIKVTNSNGVHAVGQIDASGGNYSWSGGVDGMEGSYTISVQQGTGAGKYNLSVTITESDFICFNNQYRYYFRNSCCRKQQALQQVD